VWLDLLTLPLFDECSLADFSSSFFGFSAGFSSGFFSGLAAGFSLAGAAAFFFFAGALTPNAIGVVFSLTREALFSDRSLALFSLS